MELFLSRLFKAHPEYQKFHKDIKDMDLSDDEKVRENISFELQATPVFVLIDDLIECLENYDDAVALLQDAGRKHVDIPDFKSRYFKVCIHVILF